MTEKRPAYHRRQDLKRLREQALPLPLMVSDNGEAYVVETDDVLNRQVLCAGRYQVVYEFLRGFAAGGQPHSETEFRQMVLRLRAVEAAKAQLQAQIRQHWVPRCDSMQNAIALLNACTESLVAERDAALAQVQLTEARQCDCGAELTNCRDCAVSDYQAAHPDCAQCCQPAQGPRYD